MNIDFKSLEKRYGTSLATKIAEEIARADQKHFSFYRIPEAMKALQRVSDDDRDDDIFPAPRSRVA